LTVAVYVRGEELNLGEGDLTGDTALRCVVRLEVTLVLVVVEGAIFLALTA